MNGDCMIFICYRKCSTCQKAKKHLLEMNVDFEERPIEMGVTQEELRKWIPLSKKEIHQFFNTSGKIYKSENYKEKLKLMTEDEKIKALSENGMLVKRPLLVGDDFVLVGYKKEQYDEIGEKYGKKQ